MEFAIVILALGLLLIAAGPRRGNCHHEFVRSDRYEYGDHRGLSYRCEKCGVEVEGQA